MLPSRVSVLARHLALFGAAGPRPKLALFRTTGSTAGTGSMADSCPLPSARQLALFYRYRLACLICHNAFSIKYLPPGVALGELALSCTLWLSDAGMLTRPALAHWYPLARNWLCLARQPCHCCHPCGGRGPGKPRPCIPIWANWLCLTRPTKVATARNSRRYWPRNAARTPLFRLLSQASCFARRIPPPAPAA